MNYDKNMSQELIEFISNNLSIEKNKIDVVIIRDGTLVLAETNDKKIVEKVFNICTKFQENKKTDQSFFPFHVYHKVDFETAMLKNISNKWEGNVVHSNFSAGDAIVEMREIDAAALFYGVNPGFTFIVKNNHSQFKYQKSHTYEQLSVSGKNFDAKSFDKVLSDDESEIEFKLISNSY